MKLLFDHNLSHKLAPRLADIFPNSTQTKLLGFSTVSDLVVWQHAKDNGFVVVTLDKDFAGSNNQTSRELTVGAYSVKFAAHQRY